MKVYEHIDNVRCAVRYHKDSARLCMVDVSVLLDEYEALSDIVDEMQSLLRGLQNYSREATIPG